jgi:hypothetical protein
MERVAGCNKELGDKPTLTTQMELRRAIGENGKREFSNWPGGGPFSSKRKEGP